MCIPERDLLVAPSSIPGAGLGLFTKVSIAKGTDIVEYKGRITTWKNVLGGKSFNGYVYFINRNYVIDAMKMKSALARYANDAAGISRLKGVGNNCVYNVVKKKVYIQATKSIAAGTEILVAYGKDYWDVIRETFRQKNNISCT